MLIYSVTLLAVISALSWSCQALQTLVTPMNLLTRVGCDSVIHCSAVNATDIQWSTSRFSVTFTNNSRRATWKTTTDSNTTAFLSFTSISTAEADLYTCFRYFPGSTSTNSIIVDVNANPIEVEAIRNTENEGSVPPSYNLSTTFVGRPLTVICVAKTCGLTTVTFTKLGSTPMVQETITIDVNFESPFIWNPIITANLVGEYMCTANNSLGRNTSEIFTIEGTPQRAAGSISTLMSTTLLVVMLLLSTAAIF